MRFSIKVTSSSTFLNLVVATNYSHPGEIRHHRLVREGPAKDEVGLRSLRAHQEEDL